MVVGIRQTSSAMSTVVVTTEPAPLTTVPKTRERQERHANQEEYQRECHEQDR